MTAADRSALRAQVAETIGTVLNVPAETVAGASSLLDLDGFDSLAVVNILERLESDLGIEVDPDEIVPEAFDSLESLTALIARASTGAPARAPTSGGNR